jgi:hypothetical protein
MEATEVIRFAGDVSVKKAEIVSQNGLYQDIRGQVINIHVYEDMFSPFISGLIIIKESLDLINLFPLVGEELLNLEMSTPSLSKSLRGEFHIYKLSERELLSDKSVVYTLHFISKEAIIDLNKKISRGFGGKVSEIATTILTEPNIGLETIKNVLVEPSSNSTKYVSNFWSPIKNINYLCDAAVNRNGSPSFVFFENREGFNFISLETLYTPDVLQTFVNDKYSRDDRDGIGSIKNVNEDFKRILEIRVPVAFDYMDRIRSGMNASNMILYDFTKKQYSVKTFDMLRNYDEQRHLNEFPLISNNNIRRGDSLLINATKYFGNFSGFGDVTNTNILQKRISLIKQAEAMKIEIVVPGRFDYTVGKKVQLDLPRIEPVTKMDADIQDKIFSGTYLISAINHYIDKEKHECHMELIKDSFIINLNNRKKQ